MKAKDVYFGTMKFVWIKLGMGVAVTLVGAILLALFMLLGSLFGGAGLYIMFIVWSACIGVIYNVFM
ncbi:MAG: hypothetical protein K2K17_04485, partial [Lachnospiraceae bacterium]|nr:hypothetical protein [Lachnospiraceae bacterium]